MKLFLHGNTYYSHANPPEELERNFRKMTDMGINAVRVAEIWPGWSVIERSPGHYEYDILDDYVEKAVKNGLKVCMGVGINDTPFWLYEKYKDLRVCEFDGKRATRRVQSACFDNMDYREHMRAFIEDITRHYAEFDGIFSWQFGNEIRYNVKFCDCEATRLRFREWLRHEYNNDLDELNRIWGVYYRDWNEIYPYKSYDGPPTEGIAPHCIKSQQFQSWSIEELIRWGIEVMKKHTNMPIFHNNYGASGGSGSHWKISEACDVTVIDIYSTTYGKPGLYNGFMLETAKSIAKQQNKDLWIGETSAGQYGTYIRNYTEQALIENCVMEDISAGAKAVFYFRHKAPAWEQPHKFTGSQTFLRTDESETMYTKTPQNVTKFMELHEDTILSSAHLPAEVGIYYPSESIKFGEEAGYHSEALDSAFGSWALWNSTHIPVEILDTDGICSMDLSRFKIIHVPLSCLLPNCVGRALEKYVAEGGTLICEGRPGYVDEDGLLYKTQPGAGLDGVLGARENLFYNTSGHSAAISLDGKTYETELPYLKQTYRLFGGTAIASTGDGEVCGVYNSYHKGYGYIFGGAPSLHFKKGSGKYQEGSGGNQTASSEKQRTIFTKLFSAIAKKHNVTPPASFDTKDADLTVRYLINDHELLLFCINYSEENAATLLADHKNEFTELTKDGTRKACMEITIPPMSWRVFKKTI